MDRRIDIATARAELDDILETVGRDHARYIVEQDGTPPVLILSLRDFLNSVSPPPTWLQESWDRSRESGRDGMTMDEIDSEIDAQRRENAAASAT